MAYEPRAATTSHTAEISSPRTRATTPHATAPTTATAVQTTTDCQRGLALVLPVVVMLFSRLSGSSGHGASRGRVVPLARVKRTVSALGAVKEQVRGGHQQDARSPPVSCVSLKVALPRF